VPEVRHRRRAGPIPLAVLVQRGFTRGGLLLGRAVRGRLGRVWCRRRERSATTVTPSSTGSASPC
jgi:hypothetical protein